MNKWKPLAASVIGLLLMFVVVGCGSDTNDETDAEVFINSHLPLEVWTWSGKPGEPRETLGRTPAERPISIPDGTRWGVTPDVDVDIAELAAVVKFNSIPCLWVEQATDAGLAHFTG